MCKRRKLIVILLGFIVIFLLLSACSKSEQGIAVSDSKLKEDMYNSCELIGINVNKIKGFEQKEDWAGGLRYYFVYEGHGYYVYCNMDGTVESINLGIMGEKIYYRGYEPYNINDFIVDSDTELSLQMATEDNVKRYLKYPSAADFHTFSWAFGRNYDLYFVTGEVSAQNALGKNEDLSFSAKYRADSRGSFTLYYLQIGGSIAVNNESETTRPDRIKLEGPNKSESSDNGSIRIVDGELGEYGSVRTSNSGYDYVWYKIPAGKYVVSNEGKFSVLFIVGDESSEDVRNQVQFTENGEEQIVTVDEDSHIEISVNAHLLFTPSN